MLRKLVNVPTDTLVDMLLVILDSTVVLTANDVAECEQIEYELVRRSEDQTALRFVN